MVVTFVGCDFPGRLLGNKLPLPRLEFCTGMWMDVSLSGEDACGAALPPLATIVAYYVWNLAIHSLGCFFGLAADTSASGALFLSNVAMNSEDPHHFSGPAR